jgi:hypothetical protein
MDGLDARLYGWLLQVGALDHPRGVVDDVGGGQHALGDEPFDDRVAHAQLERGRLQREPLARVPVVGELSAMAHIPDMMDAPRLALAGPVPEAVEDDGDRLVVTDL